MGDGHVIEPVLVHIYVTLLTSLHNPHSLELKHLSKRSDSIIASMIELILFNLFLLNFSAHSEVNAAAETREAKSSVGSKCLSTVLGNYANTVTSSLTQGCAPVCGIAAHFLHNHTVVFLREVGGTKMLNHVVEDEETKFVALLLVASEGILKYFGTKLCHDSGDHGAVSLKENAQKFSSSKL